MSAVKALQQWCRVRCEGYRDVSITNMTTSFRDGMAFCALIHKHRPDLINFDSLKKEDVYENNKLAFKVAEEKLGIPALLDAEDMVALRVPDRLSILTYVSQYYNYFHGRSPIGGMGGIKRPADGPTDEPSGKKNQPVAAKVFPSSKPARENSPPPSSNITRPSPSPKQARNATTDVVVEKSHQTGTLSNKCVSCNKHVHLVQRQLVDGKLYHRNCAKLLLPTNPTAPLRGLPTNTPVSRFTNLPDSPKANTNPPNHAPSRLGPSWPTDKPSTPPSFCTTFSSPSLSRPASSLSSAAKESQTCVVSKPTASLTTCQSTFTTITTSINTRPTAAPRTSTTAAKTLQSKLNFFQSDNTSNDKEKKTTTTNIVINKGPNVTGKIKEAPTGHTVVVNVGTKEVNARLDTGGERAKASGVGGDMKTKASAAAFISKKLTEENNNNNSKPLGTTVALKKTDKPSQVETPKREAEGVRVRMKLKVDPSILADLQTPTETRTPSPADRSGLGAKTPDKGASKPGSQSPNISAPENSDSPAEWRLKLKPISKAAGPTQSSPKAWANGAGKPQTSELSVGPSPSSHLPSPSVSVTPPAAKGFLNGQRDPTVQGTKPESKKSKTKPGYILKEDIMKELQEIEDNLNEWEKRGVELEGRLRSSEEEGEDDSLMDELMVEWFNLIRNKQVAMRRESELVYIGKTQDLEEEQPSVEQELRKLMEKPEHLKTAWERKREEQLMAKLVEIVNDRNAIIEGLDEDRLREEEEDEQLNKMMMNFNIKKDKPKKKSPASKLFFWGNKKEG
ncbi:protein-methionine sulfoxide oxidase mical2b isoform X1 [Etheostoma cragini]|uniref:protein-methionine sulfoxide oxidase mical2b isoform X1 n=2 Tax=Etheostoma cragini TaxID=417921 RepID=UPI00155E48E5|nr:protein-methionine sulfoxide oxidase mical2b isoform X1 [Etheostoma cragini]XP_034750999.1 protein-methionine sulfoxide oxidase mical2b isoform X1 [Etheostoma cragini]XP_034751007.1 protein-methionine sulfoxide oxidase mical2b isoform X1 [Etheostoma cragini]